MAYETILHAEDGPTGAIMLNRPRERIDAVRRPTRTRLIERTGAAKSGR